MLLADVDLDLGRRGRAPTLPQLLFAACTTLVTVVVAVGVAEARASTAFWSGCVAAATATAATWLVPWRRIGLRWLVLVPLVDLVAIGLLRVDLVPELASLSTLSVIPVLWLGVDFGRRGVVLAVVGSSYVSLLPYLQSAELPPTTGEWLRVTLVPLQALGLALFAHLGIAQLRARRERLDHELEQSQERESLGRTILQTVGSGLCFYDRDQQLVFANAQARALAARGGYDLADPARPGDQVWARDGRTPVPASDQALRRAFEVEHLPDAIEWAGPTSDLTAVGWNARRVRHEDGRDLGTVILAHDVTSLLAAERTQERFLGTVSHELRTPLTSIVGFVDVIEGLAPTDEAALRRALRAIRRNSEVLGARVNELLTVANDAPAPRHERVDASALVRATLDRWRVQCESVGLHLVTDIEDGIQADIDPHQISRVVDSLVSNAVKFTPPPGEVRVQLCRRDGAVTLEVSDTGPGMSGGDRDHAFKRFHRGGSAWSGAVQGMGLGLPAVRKVVEAHQGTVELRSEPGLGTTVTVQVPSGARPGGRVSP